MKEIVFISGKGGTGKTSLCASFVALNRVRRPVLCECDVECPDLHILFERGKVLEKGENLAVKASIDPEQCCLCGLCAELCRFEAIHEFQVTSDCEGCGLCQRVCPVGAIEMVKYPSGWWYRMETDFGTMYDARLALGGENSGQLVALLRRKARELAAGSGRELILTDGPPGVGCPTISAITGCSLAAIITEPSLAGLHDLQRVVDLTRHFRVKTGVILNKSDLHPGLAETIRSYCREQNIPLWGEIPFDPDFLAAMRAARPAYDYSERIAELVQTIWNRMEGSWQ